ncbi:MAG: aminopeptidase [Lachnospiraceae bacterium]|nr:aminopeptidase [Lachnospiraceae bacterium]
MKERWNLCIERIGEIQSETSLQTKWGSYFREVASFVLNAAALCDVVDEDFETEPDRRRKEPLFSKKYQEIWSEKTMERLYSGLQKNNYVNSCLNPEYAVEKFGKRMGQLLSFVYAEMYALPVYAAEADLFEILIRMEWFVELYCICMQEDATIEEIEQSAWECCYYFISDYYDVETEKRVGEKVDPSFDFAYRLIMEADLSSPDYLYRYGEYISENEIETVRLLNEMPHEELKKMADTYTEGYRIGFVKGNKDLSKKKVVNIIYPLGFEKVIKLAIENFEKMGLKPTLMRNSHSIFFKRAGRVNGYYSTSPNRQFDYDHREDDALFLDKKLMNRKLEVLKEAYIRFEDISKKHAGPAWIEVFGEQNFEPQDKDAACRYSKKQQEYATTFASRSGKIINTYIPGEERSFTIIAFPIAEIGPDYREIMRETIALNTLPYQLYEDVQQIIIDALDTCEYVKVLGMNGNKTDLTVALCTLKNPDKMTKFENCVADVNIPVGEVFTSPALKGTDGTLHVKKVFLNELSFDNLQITFKDGMVDDYDCANYEEHEKNVKYIKDHILYHHETIPMGEFAIGTNTTAYTMGRKYKIEDKLPILIAEKTGPHFAVGDTCYSHAEDVAVFNPDGKEIVARDNEISLLRMNEEKKEKAYFQCHTDITIPYDELGQLYGVTKDGNKIMIIENGRFVLAGTELLNDAL